MQADGNLVVYEGAGVPRFDTATGGIYGAFLRLQSDCTVVVRNAADTATLWRSTGF